MLCNLQESNPALKEAATLLFSADTGAFDGRKQPPKWENLKERRCLAAEPSSAALLSFVLLHLLPS